MEQKDNTIQIKRHSHSTEFYNNVFKKSEKISSVILYVISFFKDDMKDSLLHKNLEEKAFKLHESSLKALNEPIGQTQPLSAVRQCLLELMSTVELAAAARAIPADIAATVVEQIDVVNRHLSNQYLSEHGVSLSETASYDVPKVSATAAATAAPAASKPASPKVRRPRRVSIPSNDISSDAYLVHSQLTDRAERIKTVLEAKPQATVRDVAEIVTDVSEKTIQRELNSLIEQGQVVREGERRWSRYSVVKD